MTRATYVTKASLLAILFSFTNPQLHKFKMAEPEKDLAKLSKEQEKEDAAFLANLEKESKEFDKVCILRLQSVALY